MKRLFVLGLVFFAWFVVVSPAKAATPCTPDASPRLCVDVAGSTPTTRSAMGCYSDQARCPGMSNTYYCCPADAVGDPSAVVPPTSPASTTDAPPRSNTQGSAAAPTAAPPITTGGSSCSFNGVHDPFCGQSVAALIGRVIQFLLGAAGALFLAMFVYGGAVWLTAGSSERHSQAQKTLVNAVAGMFVIILSYTMVSLLVKVSQGLGGSQGSSQAVIAPNAPAGNDAAGGNGTTPSALDRLLGG